MELLGPVADRDVVLLDASAGPAAALLTEQGARVQRSTAVGGLATGSADAVVLAGVGLDAPTLRQVARVLRPDGVLLTVVRNATSPLSLLERGPRTTLPRLLRLTRSAGLPVRARYGVLRSIAAPSTMFELQHPATAALVLRGSNVLNTGLRRQVVEGLRWAARRGCAGPLLPVVAVLCSARPLGYDPLLGRIGVLGSAEVKLLYGDPITAVEKVYTDPERAEGEAAALRAVQRGWPGLAPAVLERRSPVRTRISWLTGATLDIGRLDAEAGERWVLQAAAVLGELHRRLAPGPPVHHGDFWLGNLLVDHSAGTITGVIDWTEAGRSDAPPDLDFLVQTWAVRADLDQAAATRLRAAVDRAYADALSPAPP